MFGGLCQSNFQGNCSSPLIQTRGRPALRSSSRCPERRVNFSTGTRIRASAWEDGFGPINMRKLETLETAMSKLKFKVLGVDYGQRFTGLAISSGGFAPQPLEVLANEFGKWGVTAKRVMEIAVREKVDGVVVGLPVTDTGDIRRPESDSRQGRRCRNFASALASMSHGKNVKVLLINECFSTQRAYAGLESSWIQDDVRMAHPDVPRKKKKPKQRSNAKKDRIDAVAAALILKTYYDGPELAFELPAK